MSKPSFMLYLLFSALSAESSDDIVWVVTDETFGKTNWRHALFGEADGTTTIYTAKVGMAIVIIGSVVTVAYLVACGSAAIVNNMYYMLLFKKA